MAEPIKVAFMGFENGHCFYIYQFMRRNPELKVVAAAFAPRARIIYEKRFGRDAFEGVDLYYDDEQMLREHPEIQMCVCGGANFRHMEEFRLCAERGIHVLSMKAPTYDMQEYDEMLRLQKKHDIIVHIELEMRWKATIERIREVIASGKLGKIESFVAYNYSHNPMWWTHWMDIPEQSYGKRIPIRPGDRIFRGGALTDHPHIFDIARYILDSDFDTVYAEAAPNMRDGAETEDLVYVIGKMQNGVVFSLDPSYANREPEQARIFNQNLSKYPRPVQVEMQVNGSLGTLYADAYQADYVESMDPDTMKYRVEGKALELDDQRNLFFNRMIADIRNHTNTPAITLEEHKKTLMAQNAAYDSIYCGQPVKVEH